MVSAFFQFQQFLFCCNSTSSIVFFLKQFLFYCKLTSLIVVPSQQSLFCFHLISIVVPILYFSDLVHIHTSFFLHSIQVLNLEFVKNEATKASFVTYHFINYVHQVVYGISLFSSYVCSYSNEFKVKFKGASIKKNSYECIAHCSVKGGEYGYHVFACFVYLFVFVLEVVSLIFHSPFMNQDASLFNFQLHKIKPILNFNNNLVGLFVALITSENMFVFLHLTHVFPSAIGVVGHYACRSNVDAI